MREGGRLAMRTPAKNTHTTSPACPPGCTGGCTKGCPPADTRPCFVGCFVSCFPAAACGVPGARSAMPLDPWLLTGGWVPFAGAHDHQPRTLSGRFRVSSQGCAPAPRRTVSGGSTMVRARLRRDKLPRHVCCFCGLCVVRSTVTINVFPNRSSNTRSDPLLATIAGNRRSAPVESRFGTYSCAPSSLCYRGRRTFLLPFPFLPWPTQRSPRWLKPQPSP